MARREKKKQEVSLFPFLDILACVIGNLILIITAVVLEQVDTKPIAEQAKREAVQVMQSLTAISERQACALVGGYRSTLRYQSRLPGQADGLSARIVELAQER